MANNRVTGSYDYNAICDVCGFKLKASELRRRWDGRMVCKEDYETRHILDFYQTRNDAHLLPFTRPDKDDQREVFLKLGTETVTSGGTSTVTYNHSISGIPGADWGLNIGPSITVMAWVKLDSVNVLNQAILSNAGAFTNGSFRLSVGGIQSGNQPIQGILASVGNGTSASLQIASISGLLQVGKWHHVAWVRDGVTRSDTLYLDGVPQQSIIPSTWVDVAPIGDFIWLGRGSSTTQPLVGGLADVRVFSSTSSNAALSLHQVRWNMANTPLITGALPEPASYLRAWWKCNDNSTTTIADSSGLGNDLTINTATDVYWTKKGIY